MEKPQSRAREQRRQIRWIEFFSLTSRQSLLRQNSLFFEAPFMGVPNSDETTAFFLEQDDTVDEIESDVASPTVNEIRDRSVSRSPSLNDGTYITI
ncbi:hypothetical protein MIMGU_mgv1a017056mg [Erythranthe guttata]|uniref:Uncharacterized protein n=1 Tax=Erythranthe guttata TaxID=4155 RepID=A0A022QYL2_ERYGU|nr:hypothetical protein MIMGU_mgv1a017056mg [Erythranthe guttata]